MYWKDKNLFSEELHLEILNLLLWREDKPKLLYPACAPWICGVLVRNLPEVNKKNMLFTVLNLLLGELYLCWKIIRGCANLSDWKTLGVHAENGSFWSHHQHIDETLCCHLMPFSCESLCIGFLKSSSYWKKKKTNPNLSKLSNECNPEIKAQMDHIFTFHPKSFEVITPC